MWFKKEKRKKKGKKILTLCIVQDMRKSTLELIYCFTTLQVHVSIKHTHPAMSLTLSNGMDLLLHI